jgi:hypothetical protein
MLNIFICFSGIWYSLIENSLFSSVPILFKKGYLVFWSLTSGVLCIYWILTPIRLRISKNLFQICWLPFCRIDGVLCLTEALQFYKAHLSILNLTAQAISVVFRNFSPVPIFLRLFPNVFSISFRVSGFMWSSLIHLDLSFVLRGKNGSIHILLHDNGQMCQHHLWKCCLFSTGWF